MPITEKILTQQLARLFKLPFAPTDVDGATEMMAEWKKVLRPVLVSDAHCEAVVDSLMRHEQRCPPPAVVLIAAENVEVPEESKAPAGCEVCFGSGWKSVERMSHLGYVASYAAHCDCARGQFLKAGQKEEE